MMSLKEALALRLTAKELAQARTSFDSVGDIAILEIPRTLRKKAKVIATVFQEVHPHFKVIAQKAGGHEGTYRVQRIKVLAGEKRTVTEHKESGLRMRVDVNKAYFSPRLSTERLRIASLVKKNERVLVLFSGVGPYALVIAKHAHPAKVVAVELNPAGHRYALENIKLNKLQDRVTAVKADAKRWCLRTKELFDRIIMPLPMTSSKFLLAALRVAKKGSVIHFYAFAHEDDLESAADEIRRICVKAKRRCTVQHIVKVGQQSPYVYRVCVDFRVA